VIDHVFQVHRFIEKKHLRFVLCGSSARKLKRAGVNLLAGRALRRAMHPFVPEEVGALFEGQVAQLLRAYKDYRGLCEEIYYWAPSARSDTEVDFLLESGTQRVAVETKSGNTFTEGWCKGLRAVADLKGLRRRIIVYPRGPVLQTRDGIDVYPFLHFAELLAANSL
jgi:predicted AAA+ superfamily ATPase